MDVENIIAGLSEAQKRAIMCACDLMSNHGGFPFLSVDVVRGESWPEGLARFLTLGSDRLTPSGLAVRARLLEQGEG